MTFLSSFKNVCKIILSLKLVLELNYHAYREMLYLNKSRLSKV